MKKRILVFPCGSEIGLEIARSLAYSTHFELIGGSSVKDHGEYVYKNHIPDIPFIDAPGFMEAINRVIKEHEIDFIFPAHDSAVVSFAEAFEANALACPVIGSPADTCRLLRSKKATYEFFKNKLPVPKIYSIDDIKNANYPLFLKPDVGQGSRGTVKVASYEEAMYHLGHNKDLLILQFLPGKEYTVDCFTDSKGQLAYCGGRERVRISNGISVSSQAVNDKRLRQLARIINSRITFKGVWFFQVKEDDDGELVLMEISPRVAGTMGYSRCMGANLALLSVFTALGYEVSITPNEYTLTIDRALENRYSIDITYEHVYLDYDDLVIFEGKVNPMIIAFVFQCHNNNIKVHLITRHAGEISESLKKFRLQGLFDEIIHITREDEKFKYCHASHAIFIDDSFRERMTIARECRIPTFDAHMVEALLQ